MDTQSELQRHKINEARNSGLLYVYVLDAIRHNGGIASHCEVSDYVESAVGLTKDEAEARHDAWGIKRSYFEDGLSYAMLDMCKGRFGYEFSISLEDGLYTLCDQSCTRNAAKTYFRRALKPKKSLRDSLLADIAKAWGELRLSLSSSDLRKAKSVGLEKIRENVLSVAMSSGLDIREIIVSELMK